MSCSVSEHTHGISIWKRMELDVMVERDRPYYCTVFIIKQILSCKNRHVNRKSGLLQSFFWPCPSHDMDADKRLHVTMFFLKHVMVLVDHSHGCDRYTRLPCQSETINLSSPDKKRAFLLLGHLD